VGVGGGFLWGLLYRWVRLVLGDWWGRLYLWLGEWFLVVFGVGVVFGFAVWWVVVCPGELDLGVLCVLVRWWVG
jgi:hypothetical protein